MEKNQLRALFLCAAFALFGTAIASAETPATPIVVAQATPAPKPTQDPFTYSGYIRSYYFARTNYPQFSGTPNQAAENNALDLHGAYDFGGGLSVGGTYLYATPLNGVCENPANHSAPPCGGFKATKPGYPPMNNPDDTLPDYTLNTLYEAYLQYKDPSTLVRLGDQVINTPWANSSDSRLKPAAFRGGVISYNLDKNWSIDAMDMSSWEDRVQSDFVNSTLVTENAAYPDDGGIGNTGIPSHGVYTNNGFYYAHAGYKGNGLSANLHYYAFDQIATAVWADATYTWKAYANPFISFQGGTEANTGTSLAGKIDSQIFGVQGGVTPFTNVSFSVGADFVPMKNQAITLPTGVTCSSAHEIKGTLMYWLPSGGTPNCISAGTGTATIYYGGWASPYTDSYATDPLFDTSISQGMADRHSTGSGLKIAGTFLADKKQLRLIASQAWYVYGNSTVGVSPTQETDIDATYFFNKIGKGAYHGLSLRNRWANRTQAFTAAYGGLAQFTYDRTQLEYDF